MAGLNNIREAYEQVYAQMDEALSADEKALRRELAADKRASKMDAQVGAKYASSEGQSAAKADKKSRGKHIHGTVDEAVYGGGPKKKEEPEDTRMTVTAADKKANTRAWQNYKAGHKSYKAAPHLGEAKVDEKLPEHERSAARLKRYANPSGALALGGGQQRARRAEHEERRGVKKEELEMQLRAHLRERALDAAEKREKESVFKAIKPSKLAKTYPEKSPEELKSLRYAISTAQAKKNMDTSRSDKRYGVER